MRDGGAKGAVGGPFGIDVDPLWAPVAPANAYLNQLGELLTPEMAGSALVYLVRADPATTSPGTYSPLPGCKSCREHRTPAEPRSGRRSVGQRSLMPRVTAA